MDRAPRKWAAVQTIAHSGASDSYCSVRNPGSSAASAVAARSVGRVPAGSLASRWLAGSAGCGSNGPWECGSDAWRVRRAAALRTCW